MIMIFPLVKLIHSPAAHKKTAGLVAGGFFEIVVHLLSAHYPFAAVGIEKVEYQK